MRLFRKKLPYTKRLTITPPKPSPDRDGIAIVASVKDEATYIADWLSFHRAVGVRHFYLYDDGSSDGTIEIARAILDSTHLTVFPWRSRMVDTPTGNQLNAQAIAFAHAVLNFGSQYEWMAFIDVDEFMLPKSGSTLKEALWGAGGFPNISLPWHLFGTSGHKKRQPGSILINYTFRSADPMNRKKNSSNFKCIVDPCQVSEVSIHHFSTEKYGEMTSNDKGDIFSRKERKNKEFYSSEHIQLNHYYSKSEEELQEKLARGPASPASMKRYYDRVTSAMETIESDCIEDRAMVEFVEKNGIFLETQFNGVRNLHRADGL
ncbi:MAG TPA: glycosyltransferase family 92 protein [Nitrospiraceae bacterium]|nr:glycosyltransferase family 92 protein [Nitrospiraceae bacterium]